MLDSSRDVQTARVGVIGTSKRAASYFRNLDVATGIQVIALADPDGRNRDKFERLICAGSAARHYDDGATMLNEEKLDGVVIASPNVFHVKDAVLTLAKDIPLLLEKPVAVNVEQCAELWRARRTSKAPVFVGFVLRYTPFYSKIKEIIAAGTLGEILTIDADESVGTNVTIGLHAGSHRDEAISGGFILEKCCHDIDVLNWLVDSDPSRVFSMGSRTHFVSRPESEQLPRFAVANHPHGGIDYGDASVHATFFIREEQTPYELGATFPDHQSVMIEYANGTLCTLTATIGQPRPTRRIRVYGSDGALSADIDEAHIVLDRPRGTGNNWTREVIDIDAESSGHHGGDRAIQEAFWGTVTGGSAERPLAGLREGIESALVAIAAEQSRAAGQPVPMSPLRDLVFGTRGQ